MEGKTAFDTFLKEMHAFVDLRFLGITSSSGSFFAVFSYPYANKFSYFYRQSHPN